MKKLSLAAALAVGMLQIASAEFGYSVSSNGNDHLYQIDLGTGIATDLGLVNFGDAEGISFGPGNGLYSIGGSVEEFWNITTPPGSLVGPTGDRDGTDAGMDYFGGTMYNIQGQAGASILYTIDTNTGLATLVGRSETFADNIAVSTGGVAYAADWIFSDSLYTVNLSTGALTLVGALNVGDTSLQAGSDFSASGVLYNITSDGKLWTVNTATGAASFVAQVTDVTGANLSGFEGLAIAPVPEPASMAVLGLGALALIRRRRAKK